MNRIADTAPSRLLLKALSAGAAGCAVFFLVLWALGQAVNGGVLLIVMFLLLSLISTRVEVLRSLSYTMVILALVCMAMFYPSPLQGWGDFRYVTLIPLLLQLIMFGVGSQMSLKDFEGIVRMPKAVLVGLLCQFTIMPLLGFTLSRTFTFDGAAVATALGLSQAGQIDAAQAAALSGGIAAGIVLIGCSPSGLASNVMCFLARGNLALSVTITACATLLAPITTPLLMKLLAGTLVEVSVVAMMEDVIHMLVYPIMAGLLFNAVAVGKPWRKMRTEYLGCCLLIVVLQFSMGALQGYQLADIARNAGLTLALVAVLAPLFGLLLKACSGGSEAVVKKLMAYFSMFSICVILTVITAANRESLLKIGLLMILAMFLHNVGGYIFGYVIARLCRLDDRSCRTLAIELGQQNGGLANGLAASLPLDATVKTLMGIAPAVFGAMQNITGSVLATWWRRIPFRDDAEQAPESESR